jgi:hypothetical protein
MDDDLASIFAVIKPSGIYAYIDAITVWLKQPIPRSQQPAWLQLALVRRNPITGKRQAYVKNKRLECNPAYRQRLQLYPPSAEALRWLARRHDILITKVECALDWIFNSYHQLADAIALLDAHWVKRWHRGHIRIKQHCRYWGRKSAANIPLRYGDRACKVTGEVHCLHLEWRLCGAKSVQRVFASMQDLIEADWYRFWKQRLLLYAVDVNKLGRLYNNYVNGTRRRTPWQQHCNGHVYDYDARAGCILAMTAQEIRKSKLPWVREQDTEWDTALSVQRVIDVFGRMLFGAISGVSSRVNL